MTIVFAVGSANATKVGAVERLREHPVIGRELKSARIAGYEVSSGVSEQPIGRLATIEGAFARAHAALEKAFADYPRVRERVGIGLEGGLIREGDDYILYEVAALVFFKGTEIKKLRVATELLTLPSEVAQEVDSGKTLSEAIDAKYGTVDVGSKNGTIGVLTCDRMTRTDFNQTLLEPLVSQYLGHPDRDAVASARVAKFEAAIA